MAHFGLWEIAKRTTSKKMRQVLARVQSTKIESTSYLSYTPNVTASAELIQRALLLVCLDINTKRRALPGLLTIVLSGLDNTNGIYSYISSGITLVGMCQPYQQTFYLYLLYDRYRYYTDLLTKSHQSLGRQYQSLAEVELSLAQRHETHMPRYHKKYLQWSRAKVKKAIRAEDRQQEYLQEYLRQCGDLITSCTQIASMAAPGRWTGYYKQAPYPVIPCSMMPTMSEFSAREDVDEQPKYWDLSMLRERGGSTTSVPSADSGFYEPSVLSQPLTYTGTTASPPATLASSLSQPRHNSFQSEHDAVGELESMPSPAKAGAGRQRRYSENAIQLIESRFVSPRTHNRVRSVEQIPAFDRIASVYGSER